MSSLKGILFSQFAGEGLNKLVEEMQTQYKPKKGRRFNHNNITYEIGRPSLQDNQLVFEISSKIPQDELSSEEAMDSYFDAIKKSLNEEKEKPASIERENIVWDSKKDTEKERDYVKLLYSYPLESLFDNQEINKRFEALTSGTGQEDLPNVPGVATVQGKLALAMVRESIQKFGRDNIARLIETNKKVRDSLKN